MVLDGPQAWKSATNGFDHARVSERQLNTAAKTGLPGMVKPVTYRPFAEFCLDVYDALCRRGWRRWKPATSRARRTERILVESYPFAAWKSLGLKPLPSKRRAKVSDLAEAYRALRSVIPFTTNRPPNHDQLQAIVGGLPGLALEERNTAAPALSAIRPAAKTAIGAKASSSASASAPRPLSFAGCSNTERSTPKKRGSNSTGRPMPAG